MNTTSATPIPDATGPDGEYVFCREVQLWRLPVGSVFADWYRVQVFEKVAEILTSRGKVLHALQCLKIPYSAEKPAGPVSSAFFCNVGMVVYRGGDLRVFVQEEAS